MDAFVYAVTPDYIEFKKISSRLHDMCKRINYKASNIGRLKESNQFVIYPLCERFVELIDSLNIKRMKDTKVYKFARELSDLDE